MPAPASIVFRPDGTFEVVYSDLEGVLGDAAPDVLDALGDHVTRRASHVEPAISCESGNGWWVADMNPVGGPVLGPFRTRAAALKAERDWIRDNRGI